MTGDIKIAGNTGHKGRSSGCSVSLVKLGGGLREVGAKGVREVREIRICWNVVGRIAIDGEDHFGGLWAPDTPENRKDYEIIMEAGNYAYGPDSHWIEEREA